MGKSDGTHHNSSGGGRKHKSNSRMSYLKQVRGRGGGYRGGRGGGGGGRGGGDYVSAYGRDGQKKYHKQREYLGPGMRGFLLTTNFQENGCVRDGYNLLNEFWRPEDDLDKESGDNQPKVVSADGIVEEQPIMDDAKTAECQEPASSSTADVVSAPPADKKKEDDDDDEDDIDKALEKEMKELKSTNASNYKFQSVETGVKNMIFIKTTLQRPTEIAYRIFNDVFEKKETRCRYILRFIPVEGTCHFDDQSIRHLAKEIFTPYFAKGYKSYKVILNLRHSNVNKDQTINTLAEVVSEINPLNVVNLTDPEYTIVVEIIKSTMLLSVLKDFTKFKKFNITEIVSPTPVNPPKSANQQDEAAAGTSTNETTNTVTEDSANKNAETLELKAEQNMEVGCDKIKDEEEQKPAVVDEKEEIKIVG